MDHVHSSVLTVPTRLVMWLGRLCILHVHVLSEKFSLHQGPPDRGQQDRAKKKVLFPAHSDPVLEPLPLCFMLGSGLAFVTLNI